MYQLFDENIHKFSIYAKFLAVQLSKSGIERVNINDKFYLNITNLKVLKEALELLLVMQDALNIKKIRLQC